MIGVANQPKPMPPSTRQRIARPPFNSPMPSTAPTTAWELETGTSGMVGSPAPASIASSPSEANRNRTSEWATTTTQAATGESGRIRPPTVIMTRFE